MKSYVSLHTSATLASLLINGFNLQCSHAFAPQPVTFANKVNQRAAHPPHKNSYLEQLAATSTKEESTESKLSDRATLSPPTSMETTSSSSTQPKEEEQSETKSLLEKVKQAGTAGAISYALWELGAQQIIPIILRMHVFQNSNDILSWFRRIFKDFGV